MDDTYGIAPVPTSNERIAAVLAHAGTLVAWFLAPLLVYLVKRGESKYVEHQALASLLWSIAGTVVSLATCGIAIPVFMIWHVLAAVRASDGREYDYPIVGKLARDIVYGR
jgi:uncharacterized Tic20 family protein